MARAQSSSIRGQKYNQNTTNTKCDKLTDMELLNIKGIINNEGQEAVDYSGCVES